MTTPIFPNTPSNNLIHSPLRDASIGLPPSQMLSAWTDDHLTQHQRDWLKAEHEFLCKVIGPGDSVFDVGCGDARVLRSILALPIKSYIGIDTDRSSIERAEKNFTDSRCQFLAADAVDVLSPIVRGIKVQPVTHSTRLVAICIGNTLGSFEQDRGRALRVMMEETDSVIVSVCKNSPEIMIKRLEYYAKNNLSCRVDDWKTGSIFSEMWGESRSFDEDSLRHLVRAAGLERYQFSCTISPVGEMGIALVVNRNPTN